MKQNKTQAATIGDGLAVRPSEISGAGNGLFATRRFVKHEAITLYDGERISWAEAKTMRDKREHSHCRTVAFGHEVIAGLKTPLVGRGGGSFANEASTRNKLNARFRKHFHRDTAAENVYLQATREIEVGEEIYVCYGRGYDRHWI